MLKLNVLATGAQGFIGQHLIELLQSHNVIEFDTADPPIQDVKHLHISDLEIDVIVHLAALFNVFESVIYPLPYFLNNVLGTVNILEYARKHNVKKILFASSAATTHRDIPYGLAKHNAEEWCKLYHELYGLETCVLRIYNVYGFGQKKGVIHEFAEQVKQDEKLTIFGDGKQVRDYIHVSDVANSIKRLIGNSEHGIYEIGTGVKTSVNDLVAVFQAVLDRKIAFLHLPNRVGDVPYSFSGDPFPADFVRLRTGLRMLLTKEGLL